MSDKETIERLEAQNAKLLSILIDVNREIKSAWGARILPAEAISAEICQRIVRAIREAEGEK